MNEPRFPTSCPSCGAPMVVVRIDCTSCDTSITGHFTPCEICSLDEPWREVLDLFMATRGNLKAMQRSLGLSYPTVRQKVEEMFQRLERAREKSTLQPADVLGMLREGKIDVAEAERLLRQHR
ncbi:DUF2089 domain-containing protein [bacterium]|nr:DUF2089 domain-containing protein [candidate division CSSED10-310 bacterium]